MGYGEHKWLKYTEMDMGYQYLLISVVIAAFLHIAEEYKFGWIEWANGFISGITVRQFMIINSLFIVLCILAVMINKKSIVFSSSIFSLLLINALVHVLPAIKQKKYSPGLVSAVVLFVPIGVVGYVNLLSDNSITIQEFLVSLLLGIFWMSVPFIYQIVRISSEKRS